ncbi:hypothetical protein SAMN04487949_3360 [Halogranum gelatinilyticum]|uniref:Uncharacterized protein n=1 Tax=Halogranum gelatinilyticum TaxID=660521 RepID=A0A1G9YMU5_9EURY|nr:DUF6498-containing protein [Halogranum gelatinilyticum]SDN09841.1 hypothetical protein SAMN04487949_3360 [Halogranum gelatinilyticum]
MQVTDGEKRRAKLLALVALNAVPLVGVVGFGWSLVALLLIYWVELGVRLAFAALEGLFAERKPDYDAAGFSWLVVGAFSEKRGGVSLPVLPLSVQLANLPTVAVTLVIGGLAWLLFGGIGVGGVDAATDAPMGDTATTTAGFGILAVTLGRAVEAGGYFLDREYESVSAQEPLRDALLSVAGIGSALFVGGLFVASGAPGPFVLVAVFCVKLLADVVDVYRDRLEAYDERTSPDLGLAYEPLEWEPVDTTFDGEAETVRPNRLAVLVDGIVRGARSPAALLLATPLTLFGLLTLATDGGASIATVGVAAAVLFGTFAAFGTVDRLVRYLCMEYRVDDDVVGYDRLFGPQWRLPGEEFADVERARTLTDRLFGTETVVVERDEGRVRLPHLPSHAVAAVFDT